MALVNFKKGLLASLPSTYAEGTFYVTTDERAIYLDVAADKRIRLGDFQEFTSVAALEANANPSTSALYYITEGNILAKWDGAKYVQINVQKTLAELGGVSKATFDSVIYDQGEGEAKVKGLISKVADLESTVGGIVSVGGEANVIETVKVNGTALTVTDQAVDITVPTGALASKDSVSKDELANSLKSEIEGKLDTSAVTGDLLTHNAAEFAAALHSHVISEVTGLQDALDSKQAAGDYATKAEAQGYADAKDETIAAAKKAGDDAQDAVDALAAKVGEVPADKTVVGMIADAQTAATYDDTALVNRVKAIEDDYLKAEDKYDDTALAGRVTAIEGDYLKAKDIADFETKANVKAIADDLAGYKTSNDAALAGVKATADAAAAKTEVDTALAGKADKSVVDAMYTNAKIDELIQGAKAYADANDADTKYGITYDSDNKKIKLVEGGTEVEIDATDFIKDGMLQSASINPDHDGEKCLELVFNTDAGKETIHIPLTQLVDIYTGVNGERVNVAVSSDNKLSADLVAGSISKNYLDADVQASLGKADTALQSHQDISHLATKASLEAAEGKIKAIEDDYLKDADKTELQADVKVVSDALSEYKAANNAAVALKANSADVYAKTETFTKDEVNAAIATAVETALTWGAF